MGQSKTLSINDACFGQCKTRSINDACLWQSKTCPYMILVWDIFRHCPYTSHLMQDYSFNSVLSINLNVNFGEFLLQDDELAMDFVASTSNIRSHIFGINQKTKFDIKCKYLGNPIYCRFLIKREELIMRSHPRGFPNLAFIFQTLLNCKK